jgi:hypothetical protein
VLGSPPERAWTQVKRSEGGELEGVDVSTARNVEVRDMGLASLQG